jgi:hypothetical protein
MESQLSQCRVEKTLTKHAVFRDEVKLGDGIALMQCLSCGVMGIKELVEPSE